MYFHVLFIFTEHVIRPVPTDSNSRAYLGRDSDRDPISATILHHIMCGVGTEKSRLLVRFMIAIRAPLIVRLFENNRRLFENNRDYFLCEVCRERWTKIVPVFYIPSCKAGAPFFLNLRALCVWLRNWHRLEPVRFGSRFFCLCGHA